MRRCGAPDIALCVRTAVQAAGCPRKRRRADRLKVQVRDQPRASPIAVRKRVDDDEAMVDPGGPVVDWMHLVVVPVT